jgi:phosphoglycerol transferase MdoB-like AlkP superfamily enzyme
MQVSVDLSMVDLDIPFSIGSFLALAADMVTMIILIAIATWEILLIAIPATILIQYIQVGSQGITWKRTIYVYAWMLVKFHIWFVRVRVHVSVSSCFWGFLHCTM